MVVVIVYWLFHSPAKDLRYAAANHINRQCSTLQYFANFSTFKCKSNLIIMETTTHKQQTPIYDLRYCTAALAKVTDNLQPPQRH